MLIMIRPMASNIDISTPKLLSQELAVYERVITLKRPLFIPSMVNPLVTGRPRMHRKENVMIALDGAYHDSHP